MSESSSLSQIDSSTKLRILAAEDNETNQHLLTAMLRAPGYELVIAADGAEALALWVEGDFDLILMDMQMPVMDGLAATRAIRAQESTEPQSHIPIAMLTAHAGGEHVDLAEKAGVDSYITKPVIPRTLFDGIMKTIENVQAGDTDRMYMAVAN